jgi:hypothetical protein
MKDREWNDGGSEVGSSGVIVVAGICLGGLRCLPRRWVCTTVRESEWSGPHRMIKRGF